MTGSGFVLKPIPQVILELFLPEGAKRVFYWIIALVHLYGYAEQSIHANVNLQRLIKYRSQFYLRNYSFVYVEAIPKEDEAKPEPMHSWYLVAGPVWANQIATVCFVLGIFVFQEKSAYLYVCGAILWILVHFCWNWLFVLFGKPNLCHGYAAKQWFLMNSYTFLSFMTISLLLNEYTLYATHQKYDYHGPMHVVGYQTTLTTVGNVTWSRKSPKILPQHKNLPVDDTCKSLLTHNAVLEVAWGGKWGCPKNPNKHCRAFTDFKMPTNAPPNEEQWKFPCNRLACPMEMNVGKTGLTCKQEDCLVTPNWEDDHSPSFLFGGNSVNETCGLQHPDSFLFSAETCIIQKFNKSFGNKTRSHREQESSFADDELSFDSVATKHRIMMKPPDSKTDDVWNMLGNCETCTVAEVPHDELYDDLTFGLLVISMAFLAGWAILALFTRWLGWNQLAADIPIGMIPTGPPSFWQFVGFYYIFFASK